MIAKKLEDTDKQTVHEKANIHGDKMNLALLFFMYLLHGALIGFTSTLPIYFQNRKVSYADQAEFSFVKYPGSLKLIFAPVIDCIFIKKFGRRKTWLIPMQFLMGITLLFVSVNLDDWLGTEDGTRKPNVHLFTLSFLSGVLFCSLMDVALDGWSLTMVQKRNLGYVSTCQNLGSRSGEILTFVFSIFLDSKELCNLFRSNPQDYGFISLANYMMVWSLVFMISATLILIFKKDDSLEVIDDENCECKLSLKESYQYLWELAKLRPMLSLTLILFTYNIGFGPQLGVSHLKLIETGVPRDKFALLTILAFPIQTILSILLRRHIFGPRSLHAFVNIFILLLILGLILGASIFLSRVVQGDSATLPFWYTCILLIMYNTRMAFQQMMKSAIAAFFCRISDPQFGGMYMTFLHTMINFGTNLPVTLSLWCVDWLRIQICGVKVPTLMNDGCVEVDGYFTETVLFTVLAALWLCWSKKKLYKLGNLDASQWVVERKPLSTKI